MPSSNDILRGTSLHVRRQIGDLLDALGTALTAMTAGKLAGRGVSSGSGPIEEITLGTGLSMSGTTLNATGGVSALAAVGTSPNANAATLSGSTLNLEPASDTYPGVMSANDYNALQAAAHAALGGI